MTDCRLSPGRPCPAGDDCTDRPCARFEDNDPGRWTLDLIIRPSVPPPPPPRP